MLGFRGSRTLWNTPYLRQGLPVLDQVELSDSSNLVVEFPVSANSVLNHQVVSSNFLKG